MKQQLHLVLSIDVEEEGLFGGSYNCVNPGLHNVAELTRLIPLTRDAQVPLTLFCAHGVFTHVEACRTVAHMRDAWGAEVGAHLHHWNTPPLGPQASIQGAAAISTASVPVERMAQKLKELFAAGALFQGAPLTAFRMGRWDLRRDHWPLLADMGVQVDASVRPLHCGRELCAGPNHFDAPREPYVVGLAGKRIVEVPLTTTPLWPGLPHLVEGLPPLVRSSLSKWGALTLLPAYQPLWLMQLCTRAHVAAGGSTLSLTWHSSEMMAGGAPHMPHEQAVKTFMVKIWNYVQWLKSSWTVEGLTMDALRTKYVDVPTVLNCAGIDNANNPCIDWMY